MSGELWLAEGVTTYYEKLVHAARPVSRRSTRRCRSGAAVLNQVLGSPALRFRSAEDMSRMAPLVDGPPALDPHELELQLPELLRPRRRARARARSRAARAHGRAPLARRFHARDVDAPRPARRHTGRNRRRALHDRRCACTAGGGGGRCGVRRRVRRALRAGTRGARLRAPARARRAAPPQGRARPRVDGPAAARARGSRLRIAAPLVPGTPLYEAGVAEDDEILAIDGRERDGPGRARARDSDGTHQARRVALRILPRGASAARTVDVTLVEQPWLAIVPVESLGRGAHGRASARSASRGSLHASTVNR